MVFVDADLEYIGVLYPFLRSEVGNYQRIRLGQKKARLEIIATYDKRSQVLLLCHLHTDSEIILLYLIACGD